MSANDRAAILEAAYFEHPCNECGATYRVSLADVLATLRARQEWVAVHPPGACHHGEFDSYLAAVPAEALEAVDRAWRELEGRIPGSLQLHVARPPDG